VGEVEFGSPCSITQTHYLEVSNTVGLKKNDAVGNFVTDACATVAVAYNRAAGVSSGTTSCRIWELPPSIFSPWLRHMRARMKMADSMLNGESIKAINH
jgi:hypothetical protein